jgi:hypothetical protein
MDLINLTKCACQAQWNTRVTSDNTRSEEIEIMFVPFEAGDEFSELISSEEEDDDSVNTVATPYETSECFAPKDQLKQEIENFSEQLEQLAEDLVKDIAEAITVIESITASKQTLKATEEQVEENEQLNKPTDQLTRANKLIDLKSLYISSRNVLTPSALHKPKQNKKDRSIWYCRPPRERNKIKIHVVRIIVLAVGILLLCVIREFKDLKMPTLQPVMPDAKTSVAQTRVEGGVRTRRNSDLSGSTIEELSQPIEEKRPRKSWVQSEVIAEEEESSGEIEVSR